MQNGRTMPGEIAAELLYLEKTQGDVLAIHDSIQ